MTLRIAILGWGYTGTEYRWRDGAQMEVLADWIRDLAMVSDS